MPSCLRRRAVLAAVAAGVLCAVSLSPAALAQAAKRIDAPFVPTPQSTVEMMLRMARVGPGDVLYDLGSGDGRIPITAVRDFGAARAVGIDIDPERVADGIANARAAGVSDRVSFRRDDVFAADFGEATVVTMYLLQHLNLELRPKLLSMLRPGTRLVSYEFHLGDWEADEIRSPSDVPVRRGEIVAVDDESLFVYSWTVPAAVAGSWQWESGGQSYRLDLQQSFQKVRGTLHVAGASVPLDIATLQGVALHIETDVQQQGRTERLRLDAKVSGAAFEGTQTIGAAAPAALRARKL